MSPAFATSKVKIERHVVGENIWLRDGNRDAQTELMKHAPQALEYEVLDSEQAVGQAMFEELVRAANDTEGDLTVVILGGRG